jgi:hypothetical protein
MLTITNLHNLKPLLWGLGGAGAAQPKTIGVCPLDCLEQNGYFKIWIRSIFGEKGMRGWLPCDHF